MSKKSIKCDMCGSTAVDHTEIDCKKNRGIDTIQDQLDRITKYTQITKDNSWERPCMHKNCPNCHGTGTGRFGTCVHMISCPCPSCSPTMLMSTGVTTCLG